MAREKLLESLLKVRMLENNILGLMKKKASAKDMKKMVKELLLIFPMHPYGNYLLGHYLMLEG